MPNSSAKHSVKPNLVFVLHGWHLPFIPKNPRGHVETQIPSGLTNIDELHERQLIDVQVWFKIVLFVRPVIGSQ